MARSSRRTHRPPNTPSVPLCLASLPEHRRPSKKTPHEACGNNSGNGAPKYSSILRWRPTPARMHTILDDSPIGWSHSANSFEHGTTFGQAEIVEGGHGPSLAQRQLAVAHVHQWTQCSIAILRDDAARRCENSIDFASCNDGRTGWTRPKAREAWCVGGYETDLSH
jgi:hypothetical protein